MGIKEIMKPESLIEKRIHELRLRVQRIESLPKAHLSSELRESLYEHLSQVQAASHLVVQLLVARLDAKDPMRAICLWRRSSFESFPKIKQVLRSYDLAYLRASLATLIVLEKMHSNRTASNS
jgi:hypothetical protein